MWQPNSWRNGVDVSGWTGQNGASYGDPGYSQNAGQRLSRFNSNPQLPTIVGRIIKDPGDIAPDEVPMNGDLSVFPQADLSCIYAKGWTDHGITTVRYVPEQRVVEEAQKPAVIPEDFRRTLFERLDAIEAALPKSKQMKKEDKPSG